MPCYSRDFPVLPLFGYTKMPGRTDLVGSVWVPRYVLGPTPALCTMRVFEMCDSAHAGSLRVGGRSIVHVSPILFIDVNRIILLDNLLCCGTEGHNSLDAVLIFFNLKSAFSVRKTAGNSRSASHIPNQILMSWWSTREGIRQCSCRRNEHYCQLCMPSQDCRSLGACLGRHLLQLTRLSHHCAQAGAYLPYVARSLLGLCAIHIFGPASFHVPHSLVDHHHCVCANLRQQDCQHAVRPCICSNKMPC